MKIQVKFNVKEVCNNLLEDKLKELGYSFKLGAFGEVEITQALNDKEKKEVMALLNSYGMNVVNDQQTIIVQRVKAIIEDLILHEPTAMKLNISEFLKEKLPYSYTHLSRIFSENMHISIEKFVILKKIEYVKELLIEQNLSLTEIAHQLNYSSVAHLSKQFKNTTGFSPSHFIKLKKRIENNA